MKDEDLERTIDEVARRMTAGEPGAAFTSRVLGRLDESRPAWRSPWVFAALGAAAVIVIAAVATLNRPAASKGPALQAGGPADPKGLALPVSDPASPKEPAPQTADRRLASKAPAPQEPALPIPSGIDPLVSSSITIALLGDDPIVPMNAIQTDPLHAPVPLTLAPLDGDDDPQRRFE